MKRKYIRNISRLRRTQGCLTDCIGYILNLHPEHVPYFVYPRVGWNDRLKKFFKKHGYSTRWKPCSARTIPKRGTYIIQGNSLMYKNAGHVVIYKNGKMVYDPQFPSKWSNKRVKYILLLKRVI